MRDEGQVDDLAGEGVRYHVPNIRNITGMEEGDAIERHQVCVVVNLGLTGGNLTMGEIDRLHLDAVGVHVDW